MALGHLDAFGVMVYRVIHTPLEKLQMLQIKTSTPALSALPSAPGSVRGAKGHSPGAQKVAGSTLLALLGGEAFAALRATEVGCLFGFVRLILASGAKSIPLERARTYCAHFAQLDAAGFTAVVSTLSSVGVVEIGGDLGAQVLFVPALSYALEVQEVEQERRKSGWNKRRVGSTDVAPEPMRLAPASDMGEEAFFVAVGSTTSASDVDASPMDQDHANCGADLDAGQLVGSSVSDVGADAMLFAAQELAPLTPSLAKKRATRSTSAETERVLDAAGVNKEIVATIPCQGGAQAHLTRDYLKSLAPLYPLISVERQALLAAKWCQENEARRKTLKRAAHFLSQWLNRANERAETRTAVIAADRSRNGFGMGGSVQNVSPVPAVNEAAETVDLCKIDDLDDLAELSDLDVSDAPGACAASAANRVNLAAPVAAIAQPVPPVAVAPQSFALPRPRPVLRRFRPLTAEAGAQQ